MQHLRVREYGTTTGRFIQQAQDERESTLTFIGSVLVAFALGSGIYAFHT
ncbi:hypothetical protein [Enterococcus florum]|nr:hypothetical protein [Enterococcus florum]